MVYRVNAKARACLHCPSSPAFSLSLYLPLSLPCDLFPLNGLSFRMHPLHPLSDASYSADQRDFCLKHDLSLKYLKPDYLWVCHLGRRDVTPAGQWQDPPLLSSLSPFFRQERCAYAGENPTPLNSLYERETLPRPLCPSLSYPLPSSFIDEEHPTTPPSNAMKFDTFPLYRQIFLYHLDTLS